MDYVTLHEAMEAAQDGQTVVQLRDVEFGKFGEPTDTIYVNQKIRLEAPFNIFSSSDPAQIPSSGIFMIHSGAELDLDFNGIIAHRVEAPDRILTTINVDGTLNLTSDGQGILAGLYSEGTVPVPADRTIEAMANSGVVNIDMREGAVIAGAFCDSAEFEASGLTRCIWNRGTLNVSGGSIYGIVARRISGLVTVQGIVGSGTMNAGAPSGSDRKVRIVGCQVKDRGDLSGMNGFVFGLACSSGGTAVLSSGTYLTSISAGGQQLAINPDPEIGLSCTALRLQSSHVLLDASDGPGPVIENNESINGSADFSAVMCNKGSVLTADGGTIRSTASRGSLVTCEEDCTVTFGSSGTPGPVLDNGSGPELIYVYSGGTCEIHSGVFSYQGKPVDGEAVITGGIFYDPQNQGPDASQLAEGCGAVRGNYAQGQWTEAEDGEYYRVQPKTVRLFTVTFTAESMDPVTRQAAENGTVNGLPEAPVKTGYRFLGWFSGDLEFTAETPVTGDLTVEAKYEAMGACLIRETGAVFQSISEAVAAAHPGQTVALLKDVEDQFPILYGDVTLDLNGRNLNVSGLNAFNGSHVIDSSVEKGLLTVTGTNLALARDNKHMALYTGTGYIFGEMVMQQQPLATTDKGYKLVFRPVFETDAISRQYFGDGAADNQLMMGVRATWKVGGSSASQDFVYDDSKSAEVYGSNKAYAVTLSGFPAGAEVQICSIVKSDAHTVMSMGEVNTVTLPDAS